MKSTVRQALLFVGWHPHEPTPIAKTTQIAHISVVAKMVASPIAFEGQFD